MDNLFVYGSLKQGECNYDQVAGWVRRVLPATVAGQLFLRPDGYPALCLGFPGTVPGEVLELERPQEALAYLDRFEGCPSEYQRVELAAHTPEGPLQAWTYVCRPLQTSGWTPVEGWPLPGLPRPDPYTGGNVSSC